MGPTHRYRAILNSLTRGRDKNLRLNESRNEIDGVKRSINSAIRWLAIGAGGIVFELLRKGMDAYAGYNGLYDPARTQGPIAPALCCACQAQVFSSWPISPATPGAARRRLRSRQ